MQGSEFFTWYYLQTMVVGWCCTLALIPLWGATTILLVVSLGLGAGGQMLLSLFPWILVLGAILVIKRALVRPSG